MMCSRCGLDAPRGARFCPHCGVSLAASPLPRNGDGIEPILRAIARTAARLCDGRDAQIFLAEGTTLRLVAHHGPIETTRTLGEPFSLTAGTVHGRAVLEKQVVHVRDLKAAVRTRYRELSERQRATRVRTMLAGPLLSDGTAIGVITVRRIRVRPFTAKQIALLEIFATQAAVALEKARLAEELAVRNANLAEALAHQTATSEVLGVISASPTNVQSVFETIVSSARRLCEASFSSLNLLEGEKLMLSAVHGFDDAVLATARQTYPQQVDRTSTSGRAILERRVIHIEDSTLDPEYTNPVRAALGLRCVLTVPLLREGQPLGAISVWRSEVRPFSERQIALLQTFADQAVIAIGNARLFGELTEALEQQTATAEILQAISRSTMDVRPVFQTILEAGVRLSGALFGSVYRFDGTHLDMVAHHNYPAAALEFSLRTFPAPPTRQLVTGRAILERTVVHVPDVLSDAERSSVQQFAEVAGFRSALSVPMLRDGQPIGAITLWHSAPFSDKHIALLKTFADQAVIAVENVRLFKELEARNRDLTEGLERETATGEILRVISSSPTDIQPVLEAILDSGKRLCDAEFGAIFRFDGDAFVIAASTMVSSEFSTWLRSHPIRPGPATPLARVGLERRPAQVADILADLDFTPPGIYRREGMRTALAVPMLKDDALVGALTFHRLTVQPFTDQQIALLETFAAQAVIAIENVRLFTELDARNHDLTQALEQQTATAEVLRVIGSSPTDAQPVFDAIVSSAWRLLGGFGGAVYRVVGDELHLEAYISTNPSGDAALRRSFPRPLFVFSPPGEAIRRGTPVILSDIDTAEWIPDDIRKLIRERGDRSGVWVPMLREGVALGAIGVTRSEPGGFSDEQIALLRTFADQAVIAIENVRLFKELEERNRDLTDALEQQTATAEILRVISTSPTILQPVLDTVVASAARFCGAYDANLLRVDGERLKLAAHHGPIPIPVDFSIPLVRGTVAGRSVLERRALQIADIQAVAEEFPEGRVYALPQGTRTLLSVPLLREGATLGAIALRRTEVDPFTDKQIALLQTFADQAVIAIENVRLFTELGARNRDLTQALEQQTATAEVLSVIGSSPTDTQPVFDAIVHSARRLLGGFSGAVFRRLDDDVHVVAYTTTPSDAAPLTSIFPRPLAEFSGSGDAIRTGTIIVSTDLETDPRMPEEMRAAARVRGFRSAVWVPMFKEGSAIGAIGITRSEPGAFADEQIALLKTFADQAVIAIENVRLFKELQARTTELTQSVEQLTALGEVSRAVTSTLDVETVLETVVSRARQLAGADGCLIYEYDEGSQHFHSRATDNLGAAYAEALRATPLRKGEGVSGRAAEVGEAVQIADITQPSAYQSSVRDITIHAGYRAVLSVPLLREDEIIGSLILIRKTPGEFPAEIVELLKTFATQSALAIQNARLFREIEGKGRELELASKHKSQFLANMSHELRTPLNAILGYTELLLDGIYGEMSEKARETMGRIERSGRHLLALINDVLDLSKIEAGQLTLSLADYSLAEIVNTVVTAMEPLAAEKGLALRVALDPGLPLARGDDRRLSQVLLNLVGNAVKFTDAGEVRIDGKVSDGAFLVSVSDTGPGIAAEHQTSIFDEFQQVDSSNTRKKGGTGLGLSIARRILALHGGRIWVESAPGEGATFSFTLPVRVERMAQTS